MDGEEWMDGSMLFRAPREAALITLTIERMNALCKLRVAHFKKEGNSGGCAGGRDRRRAGWEAKAALAEYQEGLSVARKTYLVPELFLQDRQQRLRYACSHLLSCLPVVNCCKC